MLAKNYLSDVAFIINIEFQWLVATTVILWHTEPHSNRSKVILKLLEGLCCLFDFFNHWNGVYSDGSKLKMLIITLQKEDTLWQKLETNRVILYAEAHSERSKVILKFLECVCWFSLLVYFKDVYCDINYKLQME